MSTAFEIEKAIETLPPEELSKLREWFAERESTLADSASMFELYDSEEAETLQ
jgi:hypothetical protein